MKSFIPSIVLWFVVGSSVIGKQLKFASAFVPSVRQRIFDNVKITTTSDSYKIKNLQGGALDDVPCRADGALSPTSSSSSIGRVDKVTNNFLCRFKHEGGHGLFTDAKLIESLKTPTTTMSPKVSKDDETKKTKERIVVLGTGWGATAFLNNVNTDLYDVTVVSPRNYFLFTPLLAGASVGSLEYRSITEPIREINPHVTFLEATALYVDVTNQSVILKPVECEGNHCSGIQDQEEIYYDRLVYSVGAQTNTFGTPGVKEYCNFLKQVGDARKIRAGVVNCFERANFPGLTESERRRFLTFCIIGGGPSGIEFAAELRDFVEQDGPKYYPHLLQYVRIKVIEGTNTVLAPFHKSLQEEAIRKMNSQVEIKDPSVRRLLPPRFEMTELMLESFVKEVTEDTIILKDGSEIPYGLAVWAAGNAPLPLTQDLIEELGDVQSKEQNVARGRIATDRWLRAIGGGGTILALGDASCIVEGQLPATGQVAAQQGEFLARLLNKRYNLNPKVEGRTDDDKGRSSNLSLPPPSRVRDVTTISLLDHIAGNDVTTEYASPFQYQDLGILAYTGRDTALAQITNTVIPDQEKKDHPIMVTGFLGSELWRGIYLWKQVSWRNRFMVVTDWMKRRVFGRDITHLD